MKLPDISTSTLATLPLLDEHGDSLPTGKLWELHAAVLVFVRHFG